MDFNKCVRENRGQEIWLAAHRGVSSANIPCNTIAAYGIALQQNAEIVEIDVTRTSDGVFYTFHPGMEHAHLRSPSQIAQLSWEEVNKLRFVNQDDVPTQYGVNTLDEVLDFLKGKCYVNVDKFWEYAPEITACIRRHGMANQVIVKVPAEQRYFDEIQAHAPDLALMPKIWHVDKWTDTLLQMDLNYIGAEVLFTRESDPVATDDYIRSMHDRGLLVWGNAIVYDERAIISAGHTDDVALTRSMDFGWGWFRDHQFDIIQTDWLLMLRQYLHKA